MDTVFVVGASTFSIRQSADSSEQHMKVTITRDDRLQWTYRHASWRPLAVGCGEGSAYVWSARDLVMLPDDHDDDPSVLGVDEDLLFVFRTHIGWLLVCETSVRLVIGQDERSRVELGDVIERAYWSGGRLHVEDARGITTALSVTGGRLTSLPAFGRGIGRLAIDDPILDKTEGPRLVGIADPDSPEPPELHDRSPERLAPERGSSTTVTRPHLPLASHTRGWPSQ